MSDYLVRGMGMDGFVKVAAVCSTELVRRGAQIQKTTPNATAAFGRALTAASMMGNMQKVENGSMTLQIRGGGPIGTITVVSDAVGNVRGCVTEPNVPLVEKYPGKLDVGATVGTDGTVTLVPTTFEWSDTIDVELDLLIANLHGFLQHNQATSSSGT